MISVIIPIYNSERFLAATLDSLLRQTFKDWEAWLILDAASSDLSERIACRFASRDARFHVRRAGTQGVAAARNLGLDLAKGSHIAFLDSDDLWQPEKLARQLQAMQAHHAKVSCTGFRRLSQDGLAEGRAILPPAQITYARLLQQNCILASSAMIDRKCLGHHRFRDVGCEDFAFWLEILAGGTVALGLREPLVRYRIVTGSRGFNKWRSLKESWQILRRQSHTAWPRDLMNIGLLGARGVVKYSRF